MSALEALLDRNRRWSERIHRQDPEFFTRLSLQQAPQYLWIGCSDSRVPANEIVGMMPGELFVHRNIANVVVHTDLNCLSVIQFAVELLHVKHVIVCGHYGCSGVRAALRRDRIGLADNWLRHVQDVRLKHWTRVLATADEEQQHNRLCECNVIEQVANVCLTSCVQDAWARGQELSVHGLIYGLRDGLIRDLKTSVSSPDKAESAYIGALAALE